MKKLQVLGLKVAIKMKVPQDPQADAEWHPEFNEIWINPHTEDDRMALILHELFHVIWLRAGIYQTRIIEQVEEILAEGFANTIRENITTLYQIHTKLEKKRSK